MYLLKRCHGQGIGRALFAMFRDNLKESGINDFYAMMLQGNLSRGFYLKMGGRFCGPCDVTLPGRRGGRGIVEERFEWS